MRETLNRNLTSSNRDVICCVCSNTSTTFNTNPAFNTLTVESTLADVTTPLIISSDAMTADT